MNTKLKPCPFCGSNKIDVIIAGHCWWVCCHDCGGRARTQLTNESRKRQKWFEPEDRASAIKQWNSRTTNEIKDVD